MTKDEVRALERLVLAYVAAHRERMPPGEAPELWASPPALKEYEAVKAAIRSAAPARRYSDASVESYTDDLLQDALNDADAVVRLVRDLNEHLVFPLATRVYIPIDGVVLDEPEIALGSVRLLRMDDEAFERLVVRPYADNAHSRAVSHDKVAAAAMAVDRQRERLRLLRGRACVEVTLDIDIEGALPVAESVAEDVCDFLQVCVAALHQRRFNNPVRASNGVVQGWTMVFAASDGPRPRTNTVGTLDFGGPPVVVNGAWLDRLRDTGVLALGERLGAARVSEYQGMLRRAVRWFAKAERERHPDDRKLAYVTAVDLFFSETGPGATRRFCEGFGLAISEDPAAVAHHARKAYRAYSSRSRTSHDGDVDIETEETADALGRNVLRVLVGMATHNFSTRADVEAWIDHRKDAMTEEERTVLEESWKRAVVRQDDALLWSLVQLRVPISMVAYDNMQRRQYVLWRLLADASRDRERLCELRPLAESVARAIRRIQADQDLVDVVLASLSSLAWVGRGFVDRMASDFA